MATNVIVNPPGVQIPENTFVVYRPNGNSMTITGLQGLNCDVRADGSLVITYGEILSCSLKTTGKASTRSHSPRKGLIRRERPLTRQVARVMGT